MVTRVLIVGGYGNFGSYIARALANDANIHLLIGGRSQARAVSFAASLQSKNKSDGCALDIDGDLDGRFRQLRPDLVIHTTGPFQTQDHRVARAAVAAGAHYLDLADAREFVASIENLNVAAKAAKVAVISGASSVPCLTAALIEHYLPSFERLDSAEYGISAAQATNRGLGTAAAILSYVGKSFLIWRDGRRHRVFGWQGLHAVKYPELGRRLFGYCDIPDLELFPKRYPDLRTLKFSAGHEVKLLHLGTWLLSWAVRFGLLPRLSRFAPALLNLSFLFDGVGSDRSGLHMFLRGSGSHHQLKQIRIFLIARQGQGPNIPCIPAILLAKRIAAGRAPEPGARPCLDLIGLDEYLEALKDFDISLTVEGADGSVSR